MAANDEVASAADTRARGGVKASQPLTAARLAAPPAVRLVDCTVRPRLEEARRKFHAYLSVDMAHTVMLAEQGILTREQAARILTTLTEIERLGPDGFPMDPAYGSFLLQVEKYLIDRIGENVAGRMHIGRSRIDHNAAVARLYARDALLTVIAHVVGLEEAVLALAARHVDTVMPGYSHLQHAQPWTFGHYLLKHFAVFERDLQRLEGAFRRTNLSSLGGAATAGTSWPLDRQRVADLLGHDGVVTHSYDASEFTPDFPLENAAVLSIAINNLGHLAEDLYLWHAWEFRMVEIADEYCDTSSIMPQKKNATALEVVRGFAGQAVGWLPAVLAIYKGASSSDCDHAYVPDVTVEAAETVWKAADLMRGVLDTIVVNVDVMRSRAGAFWSTASNLADEIVRRRELSFRTAHRVVARLVRNAVQAGVPPNQVTTTMVDQAALETLGRPLMLEQQVVTDALDPVRFVQTRVTVGSVHPDQVRAMLVNCREQLDSHTAWLTAVTDRLARARALLSDRVKAYTQ